MTSTCSVKLAGGAARQSVVCPNRQLLQGRADGDPGVRFGRPDGIGIRRTRSIPETTPRSGAGNSGQGIPGTLCAASTANGVHERAAAAIRTWILDSIQAKNAAAFTSSSPSHSTVVTSA
ncbi:hypothetical protein [Mycobacteroides abscessus]|uniref:hypothetical protein n=1 Tax=Mycobacteroides abscessus TaxID=36809 RepID=UPI0009411D19|nr:hypothetical protein [Mycobacteroides abscessus]